MLLCQDGDAKDEDRWVGGGRRYNEGPGEGKAFGKCRERELIAMWGRCAGTFLGALQ